MGYNKDIPIATFRNVDDAEVICSWLNELYDENEQLKMDRTQLHRQESIWRVQAHKLLEENEQLMEQLKEKEEEEQLYAQEILQLRKTKEEILNFNELGGNY